MYFGWLFIDGVIGGNMKLVIYLCSLILFLSAFLLLKKSNNELPFIQWLGISLISFMAIVAFIAGIYGLINIPIMCYTICPVVILISCLLLYRVKKNGKQKYHFNKSDLVFLCLACLGTIAFWVVYFHCSLPLRYVSVDASVHCRWAKEVALTHKLDSNLFFGNLNDGLVMEAFIPITGINGFYHSFTLMRIFDFFLAGLLFYGIVCEIPKGKYQHIVTWFLTATYLVGYPLYAIIFGFVYFGDGVTVISWLIINCMLYKDKLIDKKMVLILLNLSLFCLFITYTLFVPSIFVSVFVYVLMLVKKNGVKFISKETILEEIKIFLIPCIIGMAYAYVNLKEVGSNGGISNDGGKYFDLYSNFIFLIPFTLSYMYKEFKRKEVNIVCVLFIVVTLFTLLLFGLSWVGYVSTYYLSKMYNIIWLLCYVMLISEIISLSEKEKAFVNGMAAVFIVLCGFVVIDADDAFLERGYIRQSSSSFVDIYYFNGDFLLGTGIIDESQIDFYNKASEYTTEKILYIGEEISANWYKTFADQTEIETSSDINTVQERIKNNEYQYLAITNVYYNEMQDIFNKYGEVVYTDSYGVILEALK